MKLERNRAERRSKHGVPILYNGVPYLIFAALAAGFLLGAPQLAAASAIAQSDKSTVSATERKQLPFALAGYLGKTNSVISRGFTEEDFTYTGSYTWVDDGDGNYRAKFLTSGTFTPAKKIIIDVFLVGGGGGGRNCAANASYAGGGGAGGLTGTYFSITLTAGTSYAVTIGAGGAKDGGTGGTTSISGSDITTMSKAGGTPGASYVYGGSGGSGGGADGDAGVGGSDGSNGVDSRSLGHQGTGQGTTTYEFGDASLALYAGGGGGGGRHGNGAVGGSGGGGHGGNSNYNDMLSAGVAGAINSGGGGGGGAMSETDAGISAAGGSGILIMRNHR